VVIPISAHLSHTTPQTAADLGTARVHEDTVSSKLQTSQRQLAFFRKFQPTSPFPDLRPPTDTLRPTNWKTQTDASNAPINNINIHKSTKLIHKIS
tara:strand:- start:231 stop:518 length:288 start_codon:yes stop_codon:yes gene_type:complete